MNIQDIFTRLGLSKHAGTVYDFLSEHVDSSPTEIGNTCDLHRPAVYRVLRELGEQNLVEKKTVGKRTMYTAAPLRRLETLFAQAHEEVQSVVEKRYTELAKKGKLYELRDNIQIYEGRAAVEAVYDDIVDSCKKGEMFYRYTSEQDLDQVNALLADDYRARRDQKKLERQVISNPKSSGQKKPRLERFIKNIPAGDDVFMQNFIQLIYANKVALIDLNQMRALVIEDASMAAFQKTIFSHLYRRL